MSGSPILEGEGGSESEVDNLVESALRSIIQGRRAEEKAGEEKWTREREGDFMGSPPRHDMPKPAEYAESTASKLRDELQRQKRMVRDQDRSFGNNSGMKGGLDTRLLQLESVGEILENLKKCNTVEKVMRCIAEDVVEVLAVEQASLFMIDYRGKSVFLWTAGLGGAYDEVFEAPIGTGLVGESALTGKVLTTTGMFGYSTLGTDCNTYP